ncbi:MAG: APC family permease [Caulobacteraceae bacterium]
MTDHHTAHAPPSLLRILGLVFGLAVVVGGMVGSGIMRAPGVVALGITSPPLFLLAWAAGGGVAMLSAMPLVEAGASVPRAGGSYAIAARAFGPAAGFLTGWISWLQYVASSAFIAVVFGEYVHRLGMAPQLSNSVLAVGLVVAVAAVNWIGTRISGASQSLASAIKGAAFLILAGVLFASRHAGPGAPVAAVSVGAFAGVTTIGAVVMAVRVIYQTYAGWDAAIYFSEEVNRPDRNVARSTFGGIAAVTVLYVLVNAAVLHVLSPAAIAGSALAVGDAAKVSLGAIGDIVITAMGLFSLAAIVNLQTMAAPRITFAMARDGVLPPILARVAKGGAPRLGVAAAAVASAAFAATGSYESIVRIYAPWSMTAIIVICLASIRLRLAEPDLPRPWKMPLFPWIAIVAAAIQASLIAVVVWDDPLAGLASAAAAIAPLPIYLIFAKTWRRGAGLTTAAKGERP